MTRDQVEELAESLGVEFVNLDGLESAIIGFAYHDNEYRLIYSAEKIIKKFMRDGMERGEAVEWAETNVFQSYFGETSPVFVQEITDKKGRN